MKRSILLLLGFASASCSFMFMGDGGMRVRGNISNYTNQDCSARVQIAKSEREVVNLALLPPEKNGEFELGFTVSPRREEYIVSIVCNGDVVASKIVNYPNDLESGWYVSFGKIRIST